MDHLPDNVRDLSWGYGSGPFNSGTMDEQIRRGTYVSPGARKLKLRERDFQKKRRPAKARYCELHATSSFSFLRGSSQPEDLVERAAELELPAVALLDRGGVFGAPRFYKAAKEAGIKALVGAEVVLDPLTLRAWDGKEEPEVLQRSLPGTGIPLAPAPGKRKAEPAPEVRLSLLVRNRTGYRSLCKLITAGALAHPKGEARVDAAMLAEHAEGLHCLVGSDEGALVRALAGGDATLARRRLDRIAEIFTPSESSRPNLHVELQRHGLRAEEHRNRTLIALAQSMRLPLLATNGVRYAKPFDKRLHDVMTCIRHHTTLDTAGRVVAAERQRYLRSAGEMHELFDDLPEALQASLDLTEELDFTLDDLGYRFPEYPLPPGETPMSYLSQLTWNAARARFRPFTAQAQAQIEKELRMIDKLDLAGYFLIVWDIVRFCQQENILAQGRGSAANSAVCYALSITAVDPVKMELLFERFLSEERGEWPDIDLDLPSGDQREKVIQYVYKRYGRHGSAMTANVITYRDRMAAREVAKVLGYSKQQVDRLAKRLGSWHYDIKRGDDHQLDDELTSLGFDPSDTRMQLFIESWRNLQNHPRHLGQHSGGMVMCAGRLDEVVPLEPAAMEDRVIVQWDKDDCADLGIIKVDLLGLGMLNALEEAVPLIREHEKLNLDLAHLPVDDPETYAMLRRADTVGVFQVESRAQMASLPRNRPEKFYDLVIQVAIIRPGPIVGKMTHPFFERRLGREEVTYPHPSLKPTLQRTLGVPIFQEQILKLAMDAAGFTGGEAEELRRAMGFKRSMERMESIELRLREGMQTRGISDEGQAQIIQAITSFALYGFPESHAASFALIAYASAYLKCHHPTAFFLSLLNAWPMGFYHPATLVKEAQRAGTVVLPIDVNHSGWQCLWEEPSDEDRARLAARKSTASPSRPAQHRREWRPGSDAPHAELDLPHDAQRTPSRSKPTAGAIRIGLRYVKGLRRQAGEAIENERRRRRFHSTDDLIERCGLHEDEATSLAAIGALLSLGDQGRALSRREALWQVARAAKHRGPLLTELPDTAPSPLPEMSLFEETLTDFAVTDLTAGRHPMEYYREQLKKRGILSAAELDGVEPERRVKTAGSVIVRQRPGTAKGLLFITLEDETGMSQAVVMPQLLKEHRTVIVGSAGLVVEGILQKRDGSLSVKADKFWPIDQLSRVPSHDFR
ncbi:MAG: error-prone DNA polymerase [Acidobacteriota bacterium]